jgi:hypothetical protein
VTGHVTASSVLAFLLAAGAPADPRSAAAEALARCGCQTDLPGAYATAPERPIETVPSVLGGSDGSRRPMPAPVAVPPQLPWLVLLVVVALALAWLVRGWHRAPAGPTTAAPGATPRGRRERPAAEAPADPESLARQGRFTDAMHALLLAALGEVVRRSRPAPPPSFTSRELLAAARLPEAARGGLGGLVAGVELAVFGGRRPGPTEYAACAEHYRRFLAAWR